jgi:hypothetical protein
LAERLSAFQLLKLAEQLIALAQKFVPLAKSNIALSQILVAFCEGRPQSYLGVFQPGLQPETKHIPPPLVPTSMAPVGQRPVTLTSRVTSMIGPGGDDPCVVDSAGDVVTAR